MKKPEPLVPELVKKFQMFLSQKKKKKKEFDEMNTLAESFCFSRKVRLYVRFSDTTKFFKKAALNKHPNCGFLSPY